MQSDNFHCEVIESGQSHTAFLPIISYLYSPIKASASICAMCPNNLAYKLSETHVSTEQKNILQSVKSKLVHYG